jgi:hypothetical protein
MNTKTRICLSLVLLSACAERNPAAKEIADALTIVDAGDDVGSPDAPAKRPPGTVALAWCARLLECQSGLAAAAFGSRQDCETAFSQIEGPESSPADNKACASAISSATCDELISGIELLGCGWKGTEPLPTASTCIADQACSSKYCRQNGPGIGRCSVLPDDALPCSNGAECADGRCFVGRCAPGGASGSSCNQAGDCRLGFDCADGACKGLGREGDQCDAVACDPRLGLLCGPLSRRCRPILVARTSEQCGLHGDDFLLCELGSDCSFAAGRTDGICRPQASAASAKVATARWMQTGAEQVLRTSDSRWFAPEDTAASEPGAACGPAVLAACLAVASAQFATASLPCRPILEPRARVVCLALASAEYIASAAVCYLGSSCSGETQCEAGICQCPLQRPKTCGTKCCASSEECVRGRCVCSMDLQTDPANCGSCGNRCPSPQSCVAGKCACGGGAFLCRGQCIVCPLGKYPNMDTCGCDECSGQIAGCATGLCMSGRCVECPPSQARCTRSGTVSCVDLQNDRLSCGSCNTRCPANQGCVGGVCRCPPLTCPANSHLNPSTCSCDCALPEPHYKKDANGRCVPSCGQAGGTLCNPPNNDCSGRPHLEAWDCGVCC